ncbi:hypothetical protein AYI68_g909 [Smittium mucronatum]|uniref:Uncharacterized protein n=1 Tax=Smittium mucronatum TaxID=133383 RepID=A0A1R0H719_9FUNG|nr:hypothetical protein AYI68_g909 [Smittium mucronatum]
MTKEDMLPNSCKAQEPASPRVTMMSVVGDVSDSVKDPHTDPEKSSLANVLLNKAFDSTKNLLGIHKPAAQEQNYEVASIINYIEEENNPEPKIHSRVVSVANINDTIDISIDNEYFQQSMNELSKIESADDTKVVDSPIPYMETPLNHTQSQSSNLKSPNPLTQSDSVHENQSEKFEPSEQTSTEAPVACQGNLDSKTSTSNNQSESADQLNDEIVSHVDQLQAGSKDSQHPTKQVGSDEEPMQETDVDKEKQDQIKMDKASKKSNFLQKINDYFDIKSINNLMLPKKKNSITEQKSSESFLQDSEKAVAGFSEELAHSAIPHSDSQSAEASISQVSNNEAENTPQESQPEVQKLETSDNKSIEKSKFESPLTKYYSNLIKNNIFSQKSSPADSKSSSSTASLPSVEENETPSSKEENQREEEVVVTKTGFWASLSRPSIEKNPKPMSNKDEMKRQSNCSIEKTAAAVEELPVNQQSTSISGIQEPEEVSTAKDVPKEEKETPREKKKSLNGNSDKISGDSISSSDSKNQTDDKEVGKKLINEEKVTRKKIKPIIFSFKRSSPKKIPSNESATSLTGTGRNKKRGVPPNFTSKMDEDYSRIVKDLESFISQELDQFLDSNFNIEQNPANPSLDKQSKYSLFTNDPIPKLSGELVLKDGIGGMASVENRSDNQLSTESKDPYSLGTFDFKFNDFDLKFK